MQIEVPFTNDRYDEEPYGEAEGAEVSRVHISRTFSGALEGSSTAELLIAKSDAGGGYIGHDVISGTLGRQIRRLPLPAHGPDGPRLASPTPA